MSRWEFASAYVTGEFVLSERVVVLGWAAGHKTVTSPMPPTPAVVRNDGAGRQVRQQSNTLISTEQPLPISAAAFAISANVDHYAD